MSNPSVPAPDADSAESQARAQVASICAMVAALSVNYNRLQELRDDRRRYAGHRDDSTEEECAADWASDNPDEAEELADLEDAAGNNEDEDEARQTIHEDPLSVEFRSGWCSSRDEMEPEEFRIVLCTGGPHVEIQGDIDSDGDPKSVRILYRDFGTSGELFDFDHAAVQRYCQEFISRDIQG